MDWRGMRRSDRVEDQRGFPALGGRGIQLGGCGLLLLIVVGWFFGINPLQMLSLLQDTQVQQAPSGQQPSTKPPADDPQADFVRAVLGDIEDTWGTIFQRMGASYEPPSLVLFRDAVQSACGFASAAAGPFYCFEDRKVYLDLSFFDELSRRFGAPGEFARAYVIAHEVGHHVQNLTGTMEQVQNLQRRSGQSGSNALSVLQELQADCYAGVWGNHAKQENFLDPNDLDAALAAASAIGDDRLQKETQGYVVPESFTHGTSEQRVHWFRVGFESGDMKKCNTYQQ
jgi:predicted metalloprotease